MYKKLKDYMQPWWTVFKALCRRSNYGPKTFCIGYNKTGTTTVGKSLETLGFRNLSFNRILWRNVYKRGGHYRTLLYFASKFDSFDDLPWLLEDMIPRLDKAFPGSRFVYLVREDEEWLTSLMRWTAKEGRQAPEHAEALRKYRQHRAFVKSYFSEASPDRFLELDVKDAHGFDILAAFVGKKAPYSALGQYNKT